MLVPILEHLFLQRARRVQQLLQAGADTLRAYEIVLSRRSIFAQMRVIDDLADFYPDVSRAQWMVVPLALKVVPVTKETLVAAELWPMPTYAEMLFLL